MKLKFTLTLSLLTWVSFALVAQTQLALNQKPSFYLPSPAKKTFGLNTNIPNQGIAMIISSANKEFGVTFVNENAKQLWQIEMDGYPLAISNLKNNILVIYAADKTFFGGVKNEYTAKLLDPIKGTVIKEQKIYEGSTEYNEDPEFYFPENTSSFMLISRETNLKKGLKVSLNPFKSTETMQKEQFRITRNYTILSYDEDLQSSKVISPQFYPDQSFKHFLTESGSIVIAHFDGKKSQIQFDLYDFKQNKPAATANLKVVDAKKFDEVSLLLKYSTANKNYYLSLFYENTNKLKKVVIGKLSFNTEKVVVKEEILDKNFLSSISKNHNPINKKKDDFKLSNYYYLNLNDLHIVDNKIAIELTSSFMEMSGKTSSYTFQSSLIKFYDDNLNYKFQSIFPRFLYSYSPDLANIKFTNHNNIATIIGNTKNWQFSYFPVYMKIDLNNGNVLAYEKIPNEGIDSKFYIRTNNVNKFSNSKLFLPYTERFGGFKSKYDTILQVIETK